MIDENRLDSEACDQKAERACCAEPEYDSSALSASAESLEDGTEPKHDSSALSASAEMQADATADKEEALKSRMQAINQLLVKNIARVKQFAGIKNEETKLDSEKKRHVIGLHMFFGVLIMAEVLLISAGSSGILNLVRSTVDKSAKVPNIVWLVVFGIVLGLLTILFLNRFLAHPISTLGNAVKQVASGDFTVRLRTDSGFKEIREISENFNLMVKELGATEILQTDFISNVSHEFKTPITAIEGYVTLLGDSDGTTPEQQKYIEKILLNTNRLSMLVGNILLLSKIDNQGIQAKPSTFRLDEQIRSSIVELEPKWTEKNCDLDVELEEIIHTGNENLLIHVWKNLIENAIKFGPRDSVIRITLQKKDGRPVFSVTDNGNGISDEDKKHIFDRFYQSDSSHKSEGNGLGLALVKQIVSAEGGEVSVSDEEGGCTFTVAL